MGDPKNSPSFSTVNTWTLLGGCVLNITVALECLRMCWINVGHRQPECCTQTPYCEGSFLT